MNSWKEAALALIFEDARAGQVALDDGTVPLNRLIEEFSAGFAPTQEIFDEMIRQLCGLQLELCDEGIGVSLREAKPCRGPLSRRHLPLGDLARLAAAFDQVLAGPAGSGKPSIAHSGSVGLTDP